MAVSVRRGSVFSSFMLVCVKLNMPLAGLLVCYLVT